MYTCENIYTLYINFSTHPSIHNKLGAYCTYSFTFLVQSDGNILLYPGSQNMTYHDVATRSRDRVLLLHLRPERTERRSRTHIPTHEARKCSITAASSQDGMAGRARAPLRLEVLQREHKSPGWIELDALQAGEFRRPQLLSQVQAIRVSCQSPPDAPRALVPARRERRAPDCIVAPSGPCGPSTRPPAGGGTRRMEQAASRNGRVNCRG